ncbi:50S ribosome-binding GTpase [Clostridium aceticum]|uniref:50S ribosome-binding GTpase n=1 Tax=Clostridium aceticum TaxID=84022 RepID=A0A0D8II16_9CLOT|nr:GTPase [Clostridium aceticum]AKL95382.1 50S ribosome-binding GTpase [Clostridium aceticum]KJF28811.1 hypothetical protein TZ02_00205 [Clostridium aceticum]
MSNCILLGKPNVGKTSFFLNFAEFLGIDRCMLEFIDFEGNVLTKHYSVNTAKNYLISPSPFKTRDVCKIKLSIPIYKGRSDFLLHDTSGLMDGINKNEHVRKSMAETLKYLYLSNIVLHMVDTSAIFTNQISTISEIDYQINKYGNSKGCYCILANKMDLKEGAKGLQFLKNEFRNTYIIPMSAIKGMGFKEVRQFVARNI